MTAYTELRKFVAPEFIYGLDARRLVGRYARNYALRRVLLVSDPGLERAGWLAEVEQLLLTDGVEVRRWTSVSPNPRAHEVMEGVAVYKQEACDGVVALGGGSVLDAAKGIGIVATNEGNILDYEGMDRVPIPMPPLICIPTTAGSASEVSQFAIINRTSDKVKIAIISKALVPDVALIDPRPLITLPPYLTACTGVDALVHASEAFVSNAASPITDMHALGAIRLLRDHLEASVREPENLDHRGPVMLACLHAGLAFSNASLGCVHALAHSLGGYLDLPHGECNALLFAPVVGYNYDAASGRYDQIGETLGWTRPDMPAGDRRADLVGRLNEFRERLGIAGNLRQRGLGQGDVPVLASKAIHDPCNATNPRAPTAHELEGILQEALG